MANIVITIVALATLCAADVLPGEPTVVVRVESGPDSVSVGDRIPVQFRVTHPDTIQFLPVEGRKDLGEVYLVGSGQKSGGPLSDGDVSDTLHAFVIPFRTGRVALPPVKLPYETTGGLKGELVTDSSFVYVKSVLPEDATDIRPLKPNTPAPSEVAWYVLIGALACAVAVCTLLLVRFLRNRRKPAEVIIGPPPRPAHEVALEELERIEGLGLLSQGRFKEYYTLISEAVRRYLGDRFAFDTMDLTTTELSHELRNRKVVDSVNRIEGFLMRCDLVKFAKLVPPYDEMESAVDVAREVVKTTMGSETEEEPAEDVLTVEDGR